MNIKPVNKYVLVDVDMMSKDSVTDSGLVLAYNSDQSEMNMIWTGVLIDFDPNCKDKIVWNECLGHKVHLDKRGGSEIDDNMWVFPETSILAVEEIR